MRNVIVDAIVAGLCAMIGVVSFMSCMASLAHSSGPLALLSLAAAFMAAAGWTACK